MAEEKRNNVTSSSGYGYKKPSRLKKFRNTFFAEDAKDVGGNLFSRIIVPGIQKLFTDSIKKAVDWIVYGDKGAPDTYKRDRSAYVSYSSSYNSEPARPVQNRRSVLDVYDLQFPTKESAQSVLDALKDLILKHNSASVADYYDLFNQQLPEDIPPIAILSIDNDWVWKDLSGRAIQFNGNGYYIELPNVTPLR